ncbi:MAG: replicative DNA helicase, partial [Endomicrobium sp.]|nr:replicative DNA helicase [Endomicrobium sp.]
MNAERTQPHDEAAEQAVLGAMLIEKNDAIKIIDFLRDTNFYNTLNGIIFNEIREFIIDGQEYDIVILADVLRGNKNFEEAGGAAYLIKSQNIAETSAHIEHYAKIVKHKSILRILINTGLEIIHSANLANADGLSIAKKAYDKIANTCLISETEEIKHHREIVRSIYKSIEDIMAGKKMPEGITSGFKILDMHTGGFRGGQLIVLGARSSMGKSTLALNIAINIAVQNKPVLIFSLEMSKEELGYKNISSHTGVEMFKMRQGKINNTEKEKLGSNYPDIVELPLYIDDTAGLTIDDIRLKTKQIALKLKALGTPLEFVIVDYLQFISPADNSAQTREREIASFSLGLKKLAKELNIPILAPSQLSRNADHRQDKKPVLADLRDSGSIGQD